MLEGLVCVGYSIEFSPTGGLAVLGGWKPRCCSTRAPLSMDKFSREGESGDSIAGAAGPDSDSKAGSSSSEGSEPGSESEPDSLSIEESPSTSFLSRLTTREATGIYHVYK